MTGIKRPLESPTKSLAPATAKIPRIHSRKGLYRLRRLHEKHIRPTTIDTLTGNTTPLIQLAPDHIEQSAPTPTTLSFMERATIGDIDITGLPQLSDPGLANDDLRLSSFRPSRYIWGGEQRRGVLMHIDDATPIDDHINKAANQDFLLDRSTPLPPEVDDSPPLSHLRDLLTFVHFGNTN